MCRAGCAAMQLGAAFGLLEGNLAAWEWFRKGWQQGTGQDLTYESIQAAAAARYLLGWREICRYMSYDGTPGTGYSWASPANPQTYYKHFEAVGEILAARYLQSNDRGRCNMMQFFANISGLARLAQQFPLDQSINQPTRSNHTVKIGFVRYRNCVNSRSYATGIVFVDPSAHGQTIPAADPMAANHQIHRRAPVWTQSHLPFHPGAG